MRVTEQQAVNYFKTLVEHQPETVVEMLMELFSRNVNVEDFINSTVEDIIDSE
jgi:hypothetical protein